ncbi:MAG: alpha/beta fold hydrolase [Proteobacteria bacterium]|nr:alpha/beta fold hydrolase [Pseudomonadota bacterium]
MIRKFFSILTCNLFLVSNTVQASELKNDGDYVMILHGIARSNKHMQKLATYLQKDGFDVINLSYPSTTHTIEDLTEIINKEISQKTTKDKRIHFIGYSMGGLMVRALIHKYNYKNLGRVVQLAPPNQGSEVADFVKNFWPYKKIFGPAGQQLITDQSALKHLFGEVNYELGIIAGNATIDPISSVIIPGENDGKVAVERTKLEGMKDHVVVSASHTFFPSNKEVQNQTLYFLKNGNFKH